MDKYELMRYRDALLNGMPWCPAELRESWWNALSTAAQILESSLSIQMKDSEKIYSEWTELREDLHAFANALVSPLERVEILKAECNINIAAQCCIAG
jgi:hypothetical protein